MLLYNIGILIYECGAAITSLWSPKAKMWREGRHGLNSIIATRMKPNERRVWIHAASLGEFEQGRPVIEQLKSCYPDIKIVLTFFSPSGYEIRKNYPNADYIFYLPTDRPNNIKEFLDAVSPEAAIFIKYEFWLGYIEALHARGIPTYLISAIFRRNSVFFKPWGGLWRKALRKFRKIYVQDEASLKLLTELGVDSAVVAGDTRFDRVADIARAAKKLPFIDHFKGDTPLFVAGSTWGHDEELIVALANNHPDIKFIIAPHEINEVRIQRIINDAHGSVARYTTMSKQDISNAQILILDTIGMLSSVYRYARWAYIGGGFGRGIHNTLEAATFGLPIAFGPNYHKFKEACDMISIGSAQSIGSIAELEAWFNPISDCGDRWQRSSSAAHTYTNQNCGATALIVEALGEHLADR